MTGGQIRPWSHIIIDRTGYPKMEGKRVATGKKYWPRSPDSHETIFLTPAQQEVLRLMSENETTKSIAIEMGISQKTVEYHRAILQKKLGCAGVALLTKIALRLGLTSLDLPTQRKELLTC